MILLRPLDPLLTHPLTMGLVDANTGMGNALILAARGSLFLRDWYAGYKDFRPEHFHHNGELYDQGGGSVSLSLHGQHVWQSI